MNALSPTVRAALIMTLCCAFIAASTFFAKVLGRGLDGEAMHPLQISWGRYVFALALLVPIALGTGMSRRDPPLKLYATRAAFGLSGVTAMFAAAAVIPLADATAISFLNPVFAMILAIPLLGERVGPVRWAAAVIALVGGALLIRPGFGALRPEALIALFAAFMMAGEIICAKFLARREGVIRMLVFTNIFACAYASLLVGWVWRWPSPAEWGVMAIVGATMMVAQALFMHTIRTADASFATPFFYATLIFAALYDGLWFGEYPDALSWAGALLIVGGAVVLALREGRAKRITSTAPGKGA